MNNFAKGEIVIITNWGSLYSTDSDTATKLNLNRWDIKTSFWFPLCGKNSLEERLPVDEKFVVVGTINNKVGVERIKDSKQYIVGCEAVKRYPQLSVRRDYFEGTKLSVNVFNEEITTNNNMKKFMNRVSTIMKKLLDTDTQLLVKAGLLDAELNPTSLGNQESNIINFLANKAALVERAKEIIAEQEKE